MENVEEMGKFLNISELPKLKQEDISNVNRPTINKMIEAIAKGAPEFKKPQHGWIHC